MMANPELSMAANFDVDIRANSLGVLTGLAAEARLVPGGIVRCAAADPQKARRLMQDMIADGVRRCVSFGLAGGLVPGLPSGTIILGSHVVSRDGVWSCDQLWQQRLVAEIPAAQVGGVWGTDAIIAAAPDKARLHRHSHCLIADMESHILAECAAAAQLPFVVVRVICDPAEFTLPAAALLPLRADGTPDLVGVLTGLLRRPTQLLDLLRLGRHHQRAMNVLARIGQHCGA
jgi:adenosylhomocysteine nucleosidase